MNGAEHPSRELGKVNRARATRNINSLVQAKITCEERWWDRNRQVIKYLDQGLSVREISNLTHRGPRQVHTVRERLADFRVEALQIG